MGHDEEWMAFLLYLTLLCLRTDIHVIYFEQTKQSEQTSRRV